MMVFLFAYHGLINVVFTSNTQAYEFRRAGTLCAGTADCEYANGFSLPPRDLVLDPSSGALFVAIGGAVCLVPPGRGACVTTD
jgi:hypothetical protein